SKDRSRMSTIAPASFEELDQIVRGEHGSPHSILGAHPHDGDITIRVFKPLASRVAIAHDGAESVLEHEYDGIWAGTLGRTTVPDYR
ncbi:GlgB N-terminal domain-containing protein, partial [Escherichia coli]|uniref:GlgB N-terminal domain-containing protein n=1 Tax=Escherichia coli TaxID=562 RepID=UPI001928855F